MTLRYLKQRQFYEDLYDRLTVESARDNTKGFMKLYNKWFELMPDEKPESLRSSFHLNLLYMILVGDELLKRYDERETRIRVMEARDEAKDAQIAEERMSREPICEHCAKTGLRIISKDLMHRKDDAQWDDPEKVLFILKCPRCDKISAYWRDGSRWEHQASRCSQCQTIMVEKATRTKSAITTTYSCPSCGHSYKDKLDLTIKTRKENVDPNFDKDRYLYCLHDEKVRNELRDAKYRYDSLRQLFKEHEEKEKNQQVYDAIAALKKLKVADLTSLLAPILETSGFTEFRLEKPNVSRIVTVEFSCLDTKTERNDYDSQKLLRKLVRDALNNTNWRTTGGSISYRLGYLSGHLRAYESEDDLMKLVTMGKSVAIEQHGIEDSTKNAYTIKGKDGEDIFL